MTSNAKGVAAIAGNGTESLTVTNAEGSIMPGTNFQFRGMAPAASLYSVGGVGGYEADEGVLGRIGNGERSTAKIGRSRRQVDRAGACDCRCVDRIRPAVGVV